MLSLAVAALAACAADAAEIGHFAPGVLGVRDFVVPEPGLYGVLYNYYYSTDRLNDADGNKVDSITINPGPGPGVTLDLEVDVDVYAVAPTLIWVSSKKFLGAKYACLYLAVFQRLERGSVPDDRQRNGSKRGGIAIRRRRPVCPAALAWLDAGALGLRAGLWLLCADGPLRH